MKKLVYLSVIVFLYGCPKEKVSPSVSMTNTELLTSTSWKLYALTETKNGVEKTQDLQDCMKDDFLTFYENNTWKINSTLECDTLPNYSKPYSWKFDENETEILCVYKDTSGNSLQYHTSTFSLYELTRNKFTIGYTSKDNSENTNVKMYLVPSN